MSSISSLFESGKPLQTKKVFATGHTTVIAIRIEQGGKLKEHSTPDPAILICLSGRTCYVDENDQRVYLESGDFLNIEPNLKHWLEGVSNSELILVRS